MEKDKITKRALETSLLLAGILRNVVILLFMTIVWFYYAAIFMLGAPWYIQILAVINVGLIAWLLWLSILFVRYSKQDISDYEELTRQKPSHTG